MSLVFGRCVSQKTCARAETFSRAETREIPARAWLVWRTHPSRAETGDINHVQKRVTSSCTSGRWLRAGNQGAHSDGPETKGLTQMGRAVVNGGT